MALSLKLWALAPRSVSTSTKVPRKGTDAAAIPAFRKNRLLEASYLTGSTSWRSVAIYLPFPHGLPLRLWTAPLGRQHARPHRLGQRGRIILRGTLALTWRRCKEPPAG